MLVGRDLTEREQAERERRRNEADFHNLVQHLPAGVLVHVGGTIRFANGIFCEIVGDTPESVVGRSVLEFFPASMLEWATQLVEKNRTSGDVLERREMVIERPDGSSRLIEYSGIPIRFGAEDARLAYVLDVTEARRAAVSLRTAAEEWQATFDAVDAPVLVLDGPSREIVRINRAALELARLRPESLTAMSGTEPWATGAHLADIAGQSGAPALDQVSEGGRVWLVSASPLSEGRLIVMLREVTNLVALQDSLRRSEAMAAMGTLVAGVAHEVRNPLFGMSATLDAVEQRFGSDPAQEPFLRAMRRELDRISRLMRDLLEYGRPPLASVHIDNEVGARAGELPMDAGRLAQVFQNLIENAVQHSPAGGRVRVVAELTKTAAIVSVLDSGPGFRPQDIARIFDPFFSQRRGGTGLGLSIVQRIVEQHGGRIEAGNRPEGGASVSVILPLPG